MTQPALRLDSNDARHHIRKELGLRNLVLCQVLNIVGVYWVGTAAKLGASHVVFWLAAALLF